MEGKRVKQRAGRGEKGICLFLFLLTALAVIKTIWISLDIDESYALAVGYRLATGEKLFVDLWEPHQLGGIVLAPFLWLYLKIAGTTTYLVAYGRIVGTLLHLAVGIFLYKTAVRWGNFPRMFSLLLFFLHFMFLPKWVQCPEFELQQYWFALLGFLCFYRYYRGGTEKRRLLFFAGAALVGQMFSYPTLIILYPVYLLGIFFCRRSDGESGEEKSAGKGRRVFKEALWFTAGCAVCGLLFLAYLRSYMTPEEFLRNVGYIFLDKSHTLVSAAVKWGKHGEQCLEILPPMAAVLILSLTAGTILANRNPADRDFADCKKKDSPGRGDRRRKILLLSVAVLFGILGLLQGAGGLFGDKNQFFMCWRFFAISLPGVWLGLIGGMEEDKRCLWFGILPGFMTLPAVLVMTNMDVNVSMAKMYVGVIATAWLVGRRFEEERTAAWEKRLFRAGILAFLAGLSVCRLVQIRVSGCSEATVLASMQKMEAGPAKGVYMVNPTAYVLEADYKVLKEQVLPQDRLLYIGNESIVYLWTGAELSTPSTQGTNAYNEIYLRYYEEHPEKMPTVIVYDKEIEENPAYLNSPYNYIIYDWMEETGYREVLDAEYMILYRRD